MKRFFKIFGITLAVIVALVIIAAAIVCYVVFTPEKLTPIVRDVAKEYILTEHRIGEVDLTVFSTFPEVGLRAKGIYIVNHIDGTPNDTVLSAPEVVATIDVMQFLNHNTLDIREVQIKNANACLYINPSGENNLDFFPKSDTVQTDTSAFTLPFDELKVGGLKIIAKNLVFADDKDTICANLKDITVSGSARSLDDIDLSIDLKKADIGFKQFHFDNIALSLESKSTAVDINNITANLPKLKLKAKINNIELTANGSAEYADTIPMNINVAVSECAVNDLLALVPKEMLPLPEGLNIEKATLKAEATLAGRYSATEMPLVDAVLSLNDGKIIYKEVYPQPIEIKELAAKAHIDLNEQANSNATINKLEAQTSKTSLSATGTASDLMGNILLDLNANLNGQLADAQPFLTEMPVNLKGGIKGTAKVKGRLDDFTNMKFDKGAINGQFTLANLDVWYDTITVKTSTLKANISLPNNASVKKTTRWAKLDIESTPLDITMPTLQTQLGQTSLTADLSDILTNSNVLYAKLKGQIGNLALKMDSIVGKVQSPEIDAYIEYNLADSKAIPTADISLAFDDLQGSYADTKAHLTKSSLKAELKGTRKDKSQPQLRATISTNALTASMPDMSAKTAALKVTAGASYNDKEENILLQWNPRLSVSLQDGLLKMAQFAEDIEIPSIEFDYSNRRCQIKKSQVIIGNSDFALEGKINDIGGWLRKEKILTGELSFVSDHTDVNELMALVSSDHGSEETVEQAQQEAKEEPSETGPFLVPGDVDVSLTTQIKEALVFDQVARDLGGRLYVKDGVLILEEMGFICNAAKLQLTAMYKTPRRNHIFVGLDYHMLDINLQELVNMIPQIDTMMPMLRSFRGAGEFHLAAETYVNSKYELKTSTTRGAVSISGKDLVLLDSETFGQIAKILLFKKKTENLVDSVSVQATLFRNEIDIYPFCITLDKYMAAVGGRHNLDMSFDYHISLLRPIYLGVDVSGTFDDLKIRPAKCRYAQDFRPIIRRDVQTQNANLKNMIDKALKRNVKQ